LAVLGATAPDYIGRKAKSSAVRYQYKSSGSRFQSAKIRTAGMLWQPDDGQADKTSINANDTGRNMQGLPNRSQFGSPGSPIMMTPRPPEARKTLQEDAVLMSMFLRSGGYPFTSSVAL
jgi:hypothetical protein